MRHGGNLYRLNGNAGGSVMDFSASINPLGAPASAKAEVRRGMSEVVHYPEPEARPLAERIAAHYGLDENAVICGNGTTELISLLPRVLKPRKVLIASPTYIEYERACKLAGAGIIRLRLKKEAGFALPIDEFAAAMKGADMAFLCNPGNPTGRIVGRDKVLYLVRAARKNKCLLVVDEAFMEFCPEHSVLGETSPHLAVLRSLTKFYALPGLRVGFGAFPSGVAARLREHKDPWSVNALAQRAAAAALSDEAYRRRTHRLMKKEKRFLEGKFSALGVRFYPSDVNYYLLEVGRAKDVAAGLLERGIMVRDCSNFKGMGGGHVRVAVRSRRENEALIRGLSVVLGLKEGRKCSS